jgi:hypothetical protein
MLVTFFKNFFLSREEQESREKQQLSYTLRRRTQAFLNSSVIKKATGT